MTNTHATQTFSSLITDLLADGKKRTTADIRHVLDAKPDKVRGTLAMLLSRGEIHICGYARNRAHIYQLGVGRTISPKRGSVQQNPRDTWMKADPVVTAAIYAMVKAGK